jgi:hypothetical protein
MGEGDPGKGVVGLIKAGFLGFEVQEFDGAKFKSVASQGGGEFAGAGPPGRTVVAEDGEASGKNTVAIKQPIAINQNSERKARFFTGLDFQVNEQPFTGAVEFQTRTSLST